MTRNFDANEMSALFPCIQFKAKEQSLQNKKFYLSLVDFLSVQSK